MSLDMVASINDIFREELPEVRRRQETQFDAVLDPVQRSVVLFGAGNIGRKILRCLRGDGIEPLCFTDNNPFLWGQNIEGIQIISPKQAASEYGDQAVFIVTIFSPGNSYIHIARQLRELGCGRVIPFAVAAWKYAELRPHFCVDLPEATYRQQTDIRQAADLLADEASQREYLAQLKFRIFGIYDGLSEPRSEAQYFPVDLFQLSSQEVFLDCGAYTGDTLTEFLHQCGKRFDRIIALEPDPLNFDQLQAVVAKLPSAVQQKINCLQLASGSTYGSVLFNASGTGSSAIGKTGTVQVDMAPLDDIVQDVAPTYIKMDIEGAELDSLRGAEKLVQSYQPKLAICVYHRPDDLWKIPLWIHQQNPDYRLFLRSYNELLEVVCYALH